MEQAANAGLLHQMRMMLQALVASKVFAQIAWLGVGISAILIGTAWAQIVLNAWNQPFYNALATRDMPEFAHQLIVFFEIAGALLALNVAQRWLTEMLRLKLREGLVTELVAQWLAPGRAVRLSFAGPIGVNPDQRLHEDARHLTELSTDLGVGLLQATILLSSFVSVLWGLSGGFALTIFGRTIPLPGYMVFAAVLYAGVGSTLTYLSGRRLIPQNAERYAREAAFRASLMQVNQRLDSIALAGGDRIEAQRLDSDLGSVLAAMRRLVGSLTRVTWVTAGYGWTTVIAPILVAAPVYFSGFLTFGGLMMAAGAFNQVQSSLRWYVDNFSAIADWRATLLRVASFRAAAIAADVAHHEQSVVVRRPSADGGFRFLRVEVSSPVGCLRLRETALAVRRGERVVLASGEGARVDLFFRAIAGLWPWGSGAIESPPRGSIAFIPQRPYLTRGDLRDLLAYPYANTVSDVELADALSAVGLERLIGSAAEKRRWDLELTDGEAVRIALARALLRPPAWLVIDECFDAVDAETLERSTALIRERFGSAGVVYLGRESLASPLGAGVAHVDLDPTRKVLRRGEVAVPAVRGTRALEPV
jgi:putative ATP-binding cassette transporter